MKSVLLFCFAALVVVGGLGLGYYYYTGSNTPTSYKTAPATRGDLSATISATGTLEPEEVVDVGCQVAGTILKFGDDLHIDLKEDAKPGSPRRKQFVDFNTPVMEGMVLAQIDPQLYQADVDVAESLVEQAKVNVTRAGADMPRLKALAAQAERDWNRSLKMRATPGSISDADFDTSQANFETAKANLAAGEANVNLQKASLKQAEATLDKAQRTLSYTTIKAPVKGVIIDRRVNVGQTVVATQNVPSLFLIAKDLSRMQIWASVNEADVDQIRTGQPVSFTVDARPEKKFTGVVKETRLNATMTQQVVTYTVVVEFDNSKIEPPLRPYLTANVQFEVDKRHDALLVPNSALRWQPAQQQIHPEVRKDFLRSLQVKTEGSGAPTAEKDTPHRGIVWVVDEGFVRPVKVKTGLSDGSVTEIVGGDLKDNTEVVVGVHLKNSGDTGTTNPFAPKLFGGKKQ